MLLHGYQGVFLIHSSGKLTKDSSPQDLLGQPSAQHTLGDAIQLQESRHSELYQAVARQ